HAMGPKLVRRKRLTEFIPRLSAVKVRDQRSSLRKFRLLFLALLLALTGCKQEAKKRVTAIPTGPQVRATVITIETKIQPDNKTFSHTIVISGDKARSLDEIDHWRLIDLKSN